MKKNVISRNGHPNMLGASVLAGLLGTGILVLSVVDRPASFPCVLIGLMLLALAAMAHGIHRKLKGMTPEEQDEYWQAVDRATEENHRRNVEAYIRRGRDGNGLG